MTRWLTVIGIGEDGIAGLSPAARTRIAAARVLYGGARHLALAEGIGTAERRTWPSPFERGVAEILALRGRPVCVLASGDPFLYGVGATLARAIPADEMEVLPAPSALSLAAARLGWPLQEVTVLSAHGRPIPLLRPHLHPHRRLLVLTPDETGPAAVAAYLTELGFGTAKVTVLEALGGPRERIRTTSAAGFDLADIAALNLVAIETGETTGLVLPFTPGLPDAAFDHDGQITKSEIRALTLAALAPRHGEHLWDIGAGSGSVGIEWMLADRSLTATALEADRARAARIAANAEALGVPGLTVVTGVAPGALAGLAPPDAVFIGGGGSASGVMDAAIQALKPGGRLVANAVTLEMDAVLLAHHRAYGGALRRIAIDRAEALGSMTGWQPARPVTQWIWHKERVR